MKGIPQAGSVWQHKKKGTTYIVQNVGNIMATKPGWLPTTISYRDVAGVIWMRPLTEWREKYTELAQ